MKNEESLHGDYREELPDDLDEETTALLRLAEAHISAKRIFVSKVDIKKRSKEKGIPFFEAKIELINESQRERKEFVGNAKKLIAPKLSKETKQKLGIKEAGRPKGSKNSNVNYSKSELYSKLSRFIRAYYESENKRPTQELAAKSLGLKYAKKLQRRLDEFGETRDWPTLVEDVLAVAK